MKGGEGVQIISAEEQKKYINSSELMQMLGLSKWKAHQLIRRLNKELESKGFITIKGRIPRAYLEERLGIE